MSEIKYLPEGVRGLAFSTRAAEYGIKTDKEVHLTSSNRESLVILQIETSQGMENIEQILRLKDVDVIFIGPTDLSMALGYRGQGDHPDVQKTIEGMVKKITKAGKAAGMFVPSFEAAEKWIKVGATYICTGSTGLISKGLLEFASGFKTISGRIDN